MRAQWIIGCFAIFLWTFAGLGTEASAQVSDHGQCDHEPGPLVYDQNFGDRGPNNQVYAVHSYGGLVYFGGKFDSVAPKDPNELDFSSNGLATWNNSTREWLDGSAGLPNGADVLALEEYSGDFYCAYQIALIGAVRVAKLSPTNVWNDIFTTSFTPNSLPGTTNLQSSGSFLFLAGDSNGDCVAGSVERFDGINWQLIAQNGNRYLDLFTYTVGSTDYLIHGSMNDTGCGFDGSVGSLNTSQTAWQNWPACLALDELSTVTGDSITEFQGILYAAGKTRLNSDCAVASLFSNNTALSGWSPIGSGPSSLITSVSPFVGTLDIGTCEWLVLYSNGWADKGWSYDGIEWETLGLGSTTLPSVIEDSHQVGGWLYIVGTLGILQESTTCSTCKVNPQFVTRIRSIADWNGNGVVQNNDKFAFSIAKNAKAPIADLNCDGKWDDADREIFNARWTACKP
ncbi:hypothetical protein JYT82_00435 [bacterium AH-315-K20]|nr:hypothetical protein [bacterium AH-315-K20]